MHSGMFLKTWVLGECLVADLTIKLETEFKFMRKLSNEYLPLERPVEIMSPFVFFEGFSAIEHLVTWWDLATEKHFNYKKDDIDSLRIKSDLNPEFDQNILLL